MAKRNVEKVIAEMANDLRPVVTRIEAGPMITKGHYGEYMLLLSRWPNDPHMCAAVALALVDAGANKFGVGSALAIVHPQLRGVMGL